MLAAGFAATLLTLPASRIAAQITIVPQPQEVKLQAGKASVSANPKVYLDKKAKITASYLSAQFKEYNRDKNGGKVCGEKFKHGLSLLLCESDGKLFELPGGEIPSRS